MDKKQYVVPIAEIQKIDVVDIVTASGNNTGGGFEGEWDTDIPEVDL